jgi:hypothetical protein
MAAVVLYAALAILWLAIPQSVTNWTRDYLPASVQPLGTAAAETVEGIANATRVPLLYLLAREQFQSAARKP